MGIWLYTVGASFAKATQALHCWTKSPWPRPKEFKMPAKQTLAPEVRTLMSGLAFGESPRWHEDRLWFSDWGAHEVIAVDLEGQSEVIVRVPSFPLCIGFLPDGRLLIVSASDGLLLRREPDGALGTHADLTGLSNHKWNDIV